MIRKTKGKDTSLIAFLIVIILSSLFVALATYKNTPQLINTPKVNIIYPANTLDWAIIEPTQSPIQRSTSFTVLISTELVGSSVWIALSNGHEEYGWYRVTILEDLITTTNRYGDESSTYTPRITIKNDKPYWIGKVVIDTTPIPNGSYTCTFQLKDYYYKIIDTAQVAIDVKN